MKEREARVDISLREYLEMLDNLRACESFINEIFKSEVITDFEKNYISNTGNSFHAYSNVKVTDKVKKLIEDNIPSENKIGIIEIPEEISFKLYSVKPYKVTEGGTVEVENDNILEGEPLNDI